MIKYTYLLIDFFTILIPFLFSFHKKIRFHLSWNSFFPAMIISGVLFLIWDEFFTAWGNWGFNPDYLIGLYIGHLPIEEILFFVCIPYSCVFTYFCFKKFGIIFLFGPSTNKIFSPVLGIILLAIGLSNYWKDYTVTTFILLSAFIFWHQYQNKSEYLSSFYFSYLILLVPFFITNGVLTGTGIESQVVWYNDQENLGIRMGTIPVEDTFYGMLLILLNITLFEYFEANTRTKISNQ